MATKLRFRGTGVNAPIAGAAYDWGSGIAHTLLVGGTARFRSCSLAEALGDGINVAQVTSVAGPTAGLEGVGGGVRLHFISPPLDADITISGTITVELWGSESSMSANAKAGVLIERIDSTGAIVSTIGQGVAASELGTSSTRQTFTISPTSTNMKKGDRIRAVQYFDDAGTMASGFTLNFRFDGSTANADGESFLSFTETFGLITSDPTGSTIYPTDTASPVSTASVDREAWTSRGAGVQTDVTNTAAGPVSPIHVTDTAGGTVVDWFTKPLAAVTLGGAVFVNPRALESSSAANAAMRCEIAVVDGDGTNPVVWGATTVYTENNTVEGARQFFVSGADTAIADGKRLRIRFYIDDSDFSDMAASQTSTLYYAGTSGGASGDTYLTFTQTLVENVEIARVPYSRPYSQLLAH